MLIDANGKSIKATPSQQIAKLIRAIEDSQRKGTDKCASMLYHVLRQGWELGHDSNLPTTKCRVMAGTFFERDASGGLKTSQIGYVALGDDYLAALEMLKQAITPEANQTAVQ